MALPLNPPEFETSSAPDEQRPVRTHRARMSPIGLVSRSVFAEVSTAAIVGISLFTFILFLQRVGSGLFSLLVRASATPKTVAYLFALAIPASFPFTVPFGVLVGVLIGLSRMSSDGEITALRSAGVPGRRVSFPALVFAFIATLGTAASTLWLTPWCLRETSRIAEQLSAAQLTAEVQPRVFEEQFQKPKVVLYVYDITPITGLISEWKRVFIADVTPPEDRPNKSTSGDGPRVTLAQSAIARPEPQFNRIQLNLDQTSTYEAEKDYTHYKASRFPDGTQLLEAERSTDTKTHVERELDTRPLYRMAYKTPDVDPSARTEARIELFQRLTLPPACLLLALVGIPLGVSSRRSAKSSAFVLTVLLAFFYYMGWMAMIRLAQQGRLRTEIALWVPDAVFFIIGTILMFRMEEPGDRDWVGRVRVWLRQAGKRLEGAGQVKKSTVIPRITFRLPLFPQIVDSYMLGGFLFWFITVLVSFVVIQHIYTFFELIGDMIRNHIGMNVMLKYLFYLTPKYLYDSTPISVLVAVLVRFSILTKNNEVTAFKASGVSVYRMAVPVWLAAAGLCGALFLFDHTVVPEANRIQDGLRNQIKGKAVQTYLRPDRKFVRGADGRFYYYKLFDNKENAMLGVSVFEIDEKKFFISRQIAAEKARWEPSIKQWVFQNGWRRDLKADKDYIHTTAFDNFAGETRT
ncbi:MAG TPA: LptF/LptG family permease, partial [Bryobacteraceae bacterium]